MKTIRRNVFETNSSSTHSLCITTMDIYDKWAVHSSDIKEDSYLYEYYADKLVSVPEFCKKVGCTVKEFLESPDSYRKERMCLTSDETFSKMGYNGLETYDERFTTPSGDKMIAFGCYGYDG